ncbi:uncharacterized protein DSM5745_01603 [Aspergillus mulundensis]|uniref:Uncharacterized protein n=1 Tax=Aspergillus mulundensis TaxID=1810919 RepID=A0A3D8SVL2_9EURO|nr:hypothetical protein DSM5745_01603 [Aspergillus mulundensis]RDW89828.1 hypothetical protein DSM5745_01603 [Aspergillus mulundensis]
MPWLSRTSLATGHRGMEALPNILATYQMSLPEWPWATGDRTFTERSYQTSCCYHRLNLDGDLGPASIDMGQRDASETSKSPPPEMPEDVLQMQLCLPLAAASLIHKHRAKPGEPLTFSVSTKLPNAGR